MDKETSYWVLRLYWQEGCLTMSYYINHLGFLNFRFPSLLPHYYCSQCMPNHCNFLPYSLNSTLLLPPPMPLISNLVEHIYLILDLISVQIEDPQCQEWKTPSQVTHLADYLYYWVYKYKLSSILLPFWVI